MTRPKRSPAEFVREHVRLTTQPFDAPSAAEVARIVEEIGSDEVLLHATDFPHWQFDGEDAVPEGIPDALMKKILVDNPLKTYPRLS